MWVRRCGICRKPGGEEWGQALLIPQQGRAEQRLLPMHRVRWCKTQNPVRAAVRGSAANGSGNKNRARNSLAVADGAGGAVQDYLECLHHRKEIARMNTILQEAKRQDDAASGVRHSHRPPPSPPPLSLLRQDDAAAGVRHAHSHGTRVLLCARDCARHLCVVYSYKRMDSMGGRHSHVCVRVSDCLLPLRLSPLPSLMCAEGGTSTSSALM